jgi:hypothetical protein
MLPCFHMCSVYQYIMGTTCHWEVMSFYQLPGNGEALEKSDGCYEHGDSLRPWTLALFVPTGEPRSVSASGAALLVVVDGWGEEGVAASGSVLPLDVDSDGSVGGFSDRDLPLPLPAFCCSSSIFCKYFACSSMRSCNCLCIWQVKHSHRLSENGQPPGSFLTWVSGLDIYLRWNELMTIKDCIIERTSNCSWSCFWTSSCIRRASAKFLRKEEELM